MRIDFLFATEDSTGKRHVVIKKDDAVYMTFLDGQPEDNNMYANFADVFTITTLLQTVMDKARNTQENITLNIEEVAWEDL